MDERKASRQSLPGQAIEPAQEPAGAGLDRRRLLQDLAAAGLGGLIPAAMASGKPSWHLPDGTFQNTCIGPINTSFADMRKVFAEEQPPLMSFPLADSDIESLQGSPTRSLPSHGLAGVND